MLNLLKWLAILAVIAIVGLIGYAYLGNMEPNRSPQELPVQLNGQG